MNTNKTVLGIVAEYDPFHNGHLFHLRQARNAVHPDTVSAVLSSCLKQRGELSMLAPHARAACAVRAGIDAAFMLPVLWTIRDAEHYAIGSVSMLCGLGITHLAFGAETADAELLRLSADFLDNPPSGFPDILKSMLAGGTGYPAALSKAVSVFIPETGNLLSSSNNILAVCYLRALKKTNPQVTPVIIQRHGNYHDMKIDPSAPSASALRSAIERGAYLQAFQAMPPDTGETVRQAFLNCRIPDRTIWDSLLMNRLRTDDLSALPDVSEGMNNLIGKAAARSGSAAEMFFTLSSKRYTDARIRRLCAMAMLGVTEERIRRLPLPSETLLLGLRKRNVPTETWKDLPIRIFSSAAVWQNSADAEDVASWRLWASCCRQPVSLLFTEKIYTE